MAGKSKSSENKENSKDKEGTETSDTSVESEASTSESTPEEPVIIEDQASEVDDDPNLFSAEDEKAASSDATSPEVHDQDDTGEVFDATRKEPAASNETDIEPSASAAPTSGAEHPSSGVGVSVLAMVFGGIIAGAIGYFGSTLAPKPQEPTFDDSALSEGVAANSAALRDLEGSVGALQNASVPEVDLSGLEGELASITVSIDSLTSDLTDVRNDLSELTTSLETQATEIDERIVALETAVPAAGELATEDELRALRTRIEEMMGEAEARLAEAQAEADAIAQDAAEMRAAAEAEALEVAAEAEAREAEARATAERQSALVALKTAIETGSGYAESLAGLGAVPDVLSANAETGVATIRSLQDSFPAAARSALSQSVTVAENASAGERLTAFLKRRTNARSLTEQEGDGPDAVLSRAEARLSDGDVASAVAELEMLPDAGKAALGDWLERAQTRLSAVAAIKELTATN